MKKNPLTSTGWSCLCLLALLVSAGCAQKEYSAGIPVGPEAETLPKNSDQSSQMTKQPAPAPANTPLGATAEPQKNIPVKPHALQTSKDCYQAGASLKNKGGRCEPQSLPYARCRSGINSCRLGYENGPLTWFACEKNRDNTSLIPSPGSVLVLGANKHNMPTGHLAYVEEVIADKPPYYQLIYSHTNYDRRCSLETNIRARYNSDTKTLDVINGAWKVWGKNLPVAGFILR